MIAHEIGHALGRDHLDNIPYNRRHDIMETIISCNHAGFKGSPIPILGRFNLFGLDLIALSWSDVFGAI